MTEDAAKRQPCIGPAPQNTGAADDRSGTRIYTCRGSTCLAWREMSSLYARELEGGLERYVPAGGAYNILKEEAFYRVTGGYCAWVGKP